MKEVMSKIKNVQEAQRTVHYLLTRPRSEMVGLGLIYGAPGLGKTRFAIRTAIQQHYIYMQLDATMTQRSFLERLLLGLQRLYGFAMSPRGTNQTIFNDILTILHAYPEAVIIIDEIDYAFGKKPLLGTIRDLVDMSMATIILIGMAGAKASLLKANAHYFDRCNAFCEFHPLDLDDTRLICGEASEVELDAEVIQYIHKGSRGTVRKVVKLIDMAERAARENNLERVTMQDLTV